MILVTRLDKTNPSLGDLFIVGLGADEIEAQAIEFRDRVSLSSPRPTNQALEYTHTKLPINRNVTITKF